MSNAAIPAQGSYRNASITMISQQTKVATADRIARTRKNAKATGSSLVSPPSLKCQINDGVESVSSGVRDQRSASDSTCTHSPVLDRLKRDLTVRKHADFAGDP